MAKLGIEKQAVADIPEMNDFTPVPPNDYVMMVVESEMKPTNDKTGQMLVLEIDIQEGQYQGRKIFRRLNIINKSSKAEEIAIKELGSLCRAIGLPKTPDDSEELHHKRFIGSVSIEEGRDYDKTDPDTGVVTKVKGKDQNGIKKYLPLSAGTDGKEADAPTAAATTKRAETKTADAPAKGKTPPWKGAKKST